MLLTFTSHSYAMGLGDWNCKTPNGNEIINTGGTFLNMKNTQILDGLDQWYFYKGNIIGQRHSNVNSSETYFVANEVTFTIDTFQTKQEWIKYIERHELKPSIWTRWYDTDWRFFNDTVGLVAIVFFYISIPLFGVIVWLFFKAIKYEKLNFRKPYTIITTLIVVFLVIRLLLDQFPQSI